MTFLVTGATGKIAEYLIPSMRRLGLPTRAMVRSGSSADLLHRQNVETVVADFRDSNSLAAAFENVGTMVFITPPHEHASQWVPGALDAAKKAGIRRVIRISAILAGTRGPSDNNRQHGQTDELLRSSGLSYVILRPHFFMQNLLADIPRLQSDNTLSAAMGRAKLGMIDVRDIADTILSTLTSEKWDGGSFDLTGPASISFSEVAAEISRLWGAPVRYEEITPSQAAAAIREAGFGEWAARNSEEYFTAYSNGWGDFTTSAVSNIASGPGRSFTRFATDLLLPKLGRPSAIARRERIKAH